MPYPLGHWGTRRHYRTRTGHGQAASPCAEHISSATASDTRRQCLLLHPASRGALQTPLPLPRLGQLLEAFNVYKLVRAIRSSAAVSSCVVLAHPLLYVFRRPNVQRALGYAAEDVDEVHAAVPPSRVRSVGFEWLGRHCPATATAARQSGGPSRLRSGLRRPVPYPLGHWGTRRDYSRRAARGQPREGDATADSGTYQLSRILRHEPPHTTPVWSEVMVLLATMAASATAYIQTMTRQTTQMAPTPEKAAVRTLLRSSCGP